MKNKIKVVCGFPGVGKSYFVKNPINGIKVVDSDSSNFDKKYFPNNYIEEIKNKIKDNEIDLIFVSTHKSVIDALCKEGIYHALIFPLATKRVKDVYIDRYKKRGNTKEFIDLMNLNWGRYADDCCSVNSEFTFKMMIDHEVNGFSRAIHWVIQRNQELENSSLSKDHNA
jgi:hypothetical protein